MPPADRLGVVEEDLEPALLAGKVVLEEEAWQRDVYLAIAWPAAMWAKEKVRSGSLFVGGCNRYSNRS